MQEIHIQHTKLPKQHHDKKTVNVKVYQNTNIDTQRHITLRQKLGGGWKYRLGTVSDTCHWGYKPG